MNLYEITHVDERDAKEQTEVYEAFSGVLAALCDRHGQASARRVRVLLLLHVLT